MRDAPTVSKPPRLWPAYLILLAQIVALVISVTPQIGNLDRFIAMMAGPIVCGLLLLVWLLFASRLGWSERIAIIAGVIALGAVTALIAHPGMGTALIIYGAPVSMLMIIVGLQLAGRRPPGARTGLTLGLVAVGWAAFGLVRLDGFDGTYRPNFMCRWQTTHEERLAAGALGDRLALDALDTPAAALPLSFDASPHDWPGFRGSRRDSRVPGVEIDLDWSASPPRERWRIPVGPAWSSFAHVGGRLFTQEQYGEQEAVVCLDPATGREIWRHAYETRFTDVVAGPGPRATPTFADGRLYTMGARASLRCLDAATGALVWEHDLMAELDALLPVWGFSGSPLVSGDVVVVYAGGRDGHGLVAYDRLTGAPAWHVDGSGMNFASAQAVWLDGEELVLFTNEKALLALDPATGAEAWRFTPSGWRGPPMVQPQMIDERSLIVPLGDGVGLARIEVERADDASADTGSSAWTVTERWSSRRLRPAFNDFVHQSGFLYGFDQSNFMCLNAETGARVWRGGRYGFGQVLLLADSAAMIVTAESGEVLLIAADSEGLRELGRLHALDAKTWNHPIVVGDRLFVRNGEEAVCYELVIVDDA